MTTHWTPAFVQVLNVEAAAGLNLRGYHFLELTRTADVYSLTNSGTHYGQRRTAGLCCKEGLFCHKAEQLATTTIFAEMFGTIRICEYICTKDGSIFPLSIQGVSCHYSFLKMSPGLSWRFIVLSKLQCILIGKFCKILYNLSSMCAYSSVTYSILVPRAWREIPQNMSCIGLLTIPLPLQHFYYLTHPKPSL